MSTTDQWFGESQFASYRRLGGHLTAWSGRMAATPISA
jgi:hypothetical protein